jgi:DNA-binding MarR family transcriptional regulator
MARGPGSSLLQQRILVSLSQERAPSVAALSRRLKTQRPSVSRAAAQLTAGGLIKREGTALDLTEAGRTEVQKITDALPKKVGETATRVSKLKGQQRQLRGFAEMAIGSSFLGDPTYLRQFTGAAYILDIHRQLSGMDLMKDTLDSFTRYERTFGSIADLIHGVEATGARDLIGRGSDSIFSMLRLTDPLSDQMRSTYESALGTIDISSFVRPAWLDEAQRSISGLMGLQRLNLDWSEVLMGTARSFMGAGGGAHDTYGLDAFLTEHNSTIARMVADMGRITALPASYVTDLLVRPTLDVTDAYEAYYTERLGNLGLQAAQPPLDVERFGVDLVLPTTTTSLAVRSTHNLAIGSFLDEDGYAVQSVDGMEGIGSSKPPKSTTPTTSVGVTWEARSAVFVPVFEKLGPIYVQRWRGAWVTLHSDSPDRIGQAAHSARELISLLLHEFAPDEGFSQEEIRQYGDKGKITRRMRVRRILNIDHDNTVSWFDHLVGLVVAGYGALSGEAHSHEASSEYTVDGLEAMLLMVASMVQFMLGQRPQ